MLRLALKEAHGQGGDKLRAVAQALVDRALTGDVPAIREIADRIDGRVAQAITGDGDDGAIIVQVIKLAALGLESSGSP